LAQIKFYFSYSNSLEFKKEIQCTYEVVLYNLPNELVKKNPPKGEMLDAPIRPLHILFDNVGMFKKQEEQH